MHPAKVPSVFITFKRRSFCAASSDITWCDEERRGLDREGEKELREGVEREGEKEWRGREEREVAEIE